MVGGVLCVRVCVCIHMCARASMCVCVCSIFNELNPFENRLCFSIPSAFGCGCKRGKHWPCFLHHNSIFTAVFFFSFQPAK